MIALERRSAFTRSQEDYLKALYLLRGDQRPVPTRELAQRLGISSPSVSEMVARLTAQGLVEHDRYRGQQLTKEGRKVALELVRHHRLLEMFLVEVLGYTWDEVHDEAERLEHVISERMEARIFELLGRPELDPHGHAIPSLAGKVRPLSDRALSDCRAGEKVRVQRVSDEDPALLRELERRGLVPGTRIEVLLVSEFESPIECRIKGRRVSIPLGLARGVYVEADIERSR
ncbi:MAG: metal-dependent transcriptional regulator [Chloroflexi bacterium]|nr:MAG: metal-dependent transcriptional regulator [Chloroflexota bacterium]TMF05336.1 MAG: metal-dependent transcriptional regulator [Chloroflexota bacterium]TMG26012.1 MAG: metal-dependent transcriptional regulator [Chloroflexota bacterium]